MGRNIWYNTREINLFDNKLWFFFTYQLFLHQRSIASKERWYWQYWQNELGNHDTSPLMVACFHSVDRASFILLMCFKMWCHCVSRFTAWSTKCLVIMQRWSWGNWCRMFMRKNLRCEKKRIFSGKPFDISVWRLLLLWCGYLNILVIIEGFID